MKNGMAACSMAMAAAAAASKGKAWQSMASSRHQQQCISVAYHGVTRGMWHLNIA